MKLVYKIGGSIALLFLGEAFLRFYGFANAPLFEESIAYEYIAKPNQDMMRFGNHIHYNSYSQRSDEPDTTKVIILGLGDSVINGGVQVDQDDIATSLFTKETGMQMLNISAGSWGPDNCAAYLRENGLFGAKAMFLVVSSHDAHDNINHQPVVGVHPSYPDKQYPLAWAELLERYVLPRVLPRKKTAEPDPDQKVLRAISKDGTGIKKDGKVFNPGFDELKVMADKSSIPLIVYLHADQKELRQGRYNEQGEEIIEWAERNKVTLVRELDSGFTSQDYRDGIYLSKSGQRKLANIMKEIICENV